MWQYSCDRGPSGTSQPCFFSLPILSGFENTDSFMLSGGDQMDIRMVLVDGKALEITATLDSALRHIRSKDGPALLWADSICINQADIPERNQQVRQMGSIYACAAHTIIFFTSHTPEAELFLNALNISNGNLRKGVPKSGIAMDTCNDLWTLARPVFLDQAWFTRIWVLQELLFSRSPWIQCGSARCRWDDFASMCSLHQRLFGLGHLVETS